MHLKFNKTFLGLCVPLTLLGQPRTTSDYIHNPNWDDIPVKEVIKCIAPAYKQNPVLIDKVVFKESSYNPNAIHDNNKGRGVAGFHKTTFEGWNKQYFKETGEVLSYDSSLDQVKLLSWAFSKGEKYRNAWSSYRHIKQGKV